MIPQAPNNNQGPWMKLEDYARSLVNGNNELYIISGPYGQGGASSANGGAIVTKLASGVVVPSYTWKIIVVIPNGNGDLNRISSTTRVIAVWMPNNNSTCPMASLWTSYRVSVDYIESQTGYDFLSNVSTTIQNVIEANVDNQ
jgi:endonuclease G